VLAIPEDDEPLEVELMEETLGEMFALIGSS
jgi:hypothetical protein